MKDKISLKGPAGISLSLGVIYSLYLLLTYFSENIGQLIFFVFNAGPQFLLYFLIRKAAFKFENFALLSVQIFLASFAGWAYYDAYHQPVLDAQIGLIFLFIPIYQFIFIGLAFGLLSLAKALIKRNTTPTKNNR